MPDPSDVAQRLNREEIPQRVVDQAWVAQRPRMARHLYQPVSFALVWQAGANYGV
jgi:hypothetical protein